MGNPAKVNRILMVKAGMTPQDVINSKQATPLQKKFALAFDSDGVEGYSEREAAVFNATLIADKGKDGAVFSTRFQDNTVVQYQMPAGVDVSVFKFAPQGDVKPYEPCNCPYCQLGITLDNTKSADNKPAQTKNKAEKSLATQIIEEFERTGEGKLMVETYMNGNIKSKNYKDANGHNKVLVEFYEEGELVQHEKITKWNDRAGCFIVVSDATYYPNGNKETEATKTLDNHHWENREFYEDGKLEHEKIQEWHSGASTFIVVNETRYYPNGNKRTEATKTPDNHHWENREFYESGNLKSNVVKEWSSGEFVETTHIEYDEQGNVINAIVTK